MQQRIVLHPDQVQGAAIEPRDQQLAVGERRIDIARRHPFAPRPDREPSPTPILPLNRQQPLRDRNRIGVYVMLLFLAGLEIDAERLREPLARLAGLAFAVSAGLGLLAAFIFRLAGQGTHPLLLAIIFMSTSAGLLLPLLKDAGEETTEFGQLVMTAAALGEIVPIMLLSLFFSAASKTTEDQAVSLAIFLILLVLIQKGRGGGLAGGPGAALGGHTNERAQPRVAIAKHPDAGQPGYPFPLHHLLSSDPFRVY